MERLFAENAQLAQIVGQVMSLSEQLDTWPSGLLALARIQGALIDVSTLMKSRLFSFQTAAAEFGEVEINGLCALLWLRPTISELDTWTIFYSRQGCGIHTNSYA